MLTQTITETLLGALTGYVTNHSAIRSLFQPGGVVEQTRDDFAREAGKLLEDQVLAQQLQLPQVQQVLAQALEAFLQQELPSVLADQTLASLPDSRQTAHCLQQLIQQFLQQERETILCLLQKHLPLDALLTLEQGQRFASQLEQLLLDTVQQEQIAVAFWRGWQTDHGQQTLEQLGLGQLVTVVIQNLAQQSQSWQRQLQRQYQTELEALLLQTIQTLQLRPVLLELDQQMAQYTLQQYLSCQEDELVELLDELLRSTDGQAFLARLTDQLLDMLTAVEAPMAQVIPTEVMAQLTPVLQQELPPLLEQVVDWLQQNRQSLYAMLEGAIDEIAEETGGMKGMLLSQLKDGVLQQVLQHADDSGLLQQLLLDEQTTQQTVALLMEQITALMTEQSVGQLVQRLNRKQQLHAVLQILLTENVQQFLQQSGAPLLKQLLAWKPGSLQLVQHQPQLEQMIAAVLLQGLTQMDWQALLLHHGDALSRQTIPQLLHLQEEALPAQLEQLIRQCCQQLTQQLPELTADQLLRPLYQQLEQWVAQHGSQWLQQLGSQVGLTDLLQLAQPALQSRQSQLLQWLLDTGLHQMQGRLSQLAEQQIQTLSNEDMLKLVEDFMGQELKPLNYLGAGMGAVAGATVGTALATALPMTATASPALLLSILAGKSAVFGAVGYGTNCAAVKGLFWPYQPVGGVTMLQGVIPKQKERFAHSMGQLVDRYVINEDILRQLLQQNEPIWMHYSAVMAADKQLWQQLSAEVAGHRTPMAQQLLQQLKHYDANHRAPMLQALGGKPFAFLRIHNGESSEQLYEQLVGQLEHWLNAQLQSNLPLRQLVSGQQVWQWLYSWVCAQPVPDLAGAVHRLLQSERSLDDVLSPEQRQQGREQIQHGVTDWMAQKHHSSQLAEQLARLLGEQALSQWLQHHGSHWLSQNLSSLFSWVQQVFLQLLHDKQEAITQAVQQAILNRMGLMQQMGYSMMNGDALVAQIIDRVLHQKLPIFLSVKRRELQALFLQSCEERIFPALLQRPVKQQQLQTMLESLLQQPQVAQGVGGMAAEAATLLAKQPVVHWGKWLKLDGLLERLQMQVGFQWQMHGAEAVASWQPLVQTFAEEQLLSLPLGRLTRGFTGSLPLTPLLEGPTLRPLRAAFFLRLQENLAITQPQQWLDWAQTTAVLQRTLDGCLQDSSVGSWARYEAELLTLQLSTQWETLLPLSCRKHIMAMGTQAVIATAQRYGTECLSVMELSHLTERQLGQMDSAQLEQVVRSFASPYLTHIENRGWLGAVFALPGMLYYLL